MANSFGGIEHAHTILVFVMASLALSRCGDGWSFDWLLRIARRRWSAAEETPVSGEYTWPVRMVWLTMACIFFAAGVAKVRKGGLEWISSDTLAIYLIQATTATAVWPARL